MNIYEYIKSCVFISNYNVSGLYLLAYTVIYQNSKITFIQLSTKKINSVVLSVMGFKDTHTCAMGQKRYIPVYLTTYSLIYS